MSRIYLECAARTNRRQITTQPELDALLGDLLPDGSPSEKQQQVERLMKLFAPPSGRTRMTRLIHPDWMFIFLLAIGLIVTYQLRSSQPEIIPVVVTLLSVTLLVYLLARKPVLERYLRQYRSELEDKSQIERAVGQWMRLYICSREPCIFDPSDDRSVALDRLTNLLHD